MVRKKIEYVVYIGIFFASAVIAWYLMFLLLMKRSEEIKVPNVVGKEIIEAWETLNENGLELSIESFVYTEKAPRYIIISQKPEGGKATRKGRRVYVKVSLGRKAYPVPDLIGLKIEDAYNLLTGSLFSIKRKAEIYSSKGNGTIISQYPPPGYESEEKSISVLVSRGNRNRFLTPDLTGLKLDEATMIIGQTIKRVEIIRGSEYSGPPDIIQDQYPLPGFPLEEKLSLFLPEELEGLRVISVRLPFGLLKKFVEVSLRYDNIELEIYSRGVYGGKTLYILFPQNKEETVEVKINGKEVKKGRWSVPRSLYSLR